MTALVIFAHGSPIESANEAVRAFAADVARAGEYARVTAAFLGGGSPDLESAVGGAVEAGADHVIIVPYFLTLGLHLTRDLPRIVDDIARIHPGVRVEVTPPLDGHPALIRAVLDRASQGTDGKHEANG
jgi:sirohydrochlorin cobaltochelatase